MKESMMTYEEMYTKLSEYRKAIDQENNQWFISIFEENFKDNQQAIASISEIINFCKMHKETVDDYILSLPLDKPRLDIENFKIIETTTKKGKTTNKLKFDYHEIIYAIEKEYNFKCRDVYSILVPQNKLMKEYICKIFNITDEDYEIGYRAKPKENRVAGLITVYSIIFFQSDIEKIVPYCDYWHYLLEHDFGDLCRGGDNYFNIIAYDDELKEPPIFAKFRDIIVFECLGLRTNEEKEQYMRTPGNEESIIFEVDW